MNKLSKILTVCLSIVGAKFSFHTDQALAQLNIGVFLKSPSSGITGDDNSGRSYADGSYASSCNDYYTGGNYTGATGDGKYLINLNGTVLSVYCDMTTAGGGWTLIAKISGSDGVDRWGYNQTIYYDTSTLGDATTLAVSDAKSAAYSSLAAKDILIRRIDGSAYVVHRYSATALSWGQFLTNHWGGCGVAVSTSATVLVDDGRDSLIGGSLYFRQYDGYFPDCSSQERAMISEYRSHVGWNECGVGTLPSGPGVAYWDAISYPAGSINVQGDPGGTLENYALLVR